MTAKIYILSKLTRQTTEHGMIVERSFTVNRDINQRIEHIVLSAPDVKVG